MVAKKTSYNSQLTGLISGLILPLIALLIFYYMRNMDNPAVFFNQIIKAGIISHLVSLCVVPNLLLFFIFMWTNRLLSARGVISATFIYALIVLGLKIF